MVMLRHHAGEQIDGGWEQLHGDLLVAVRWWANFRWLN
jgi:hypothetical protein